MSKNSRRKTSSKRNTNNDDFETKIEKIRSALKENYIQQKKLMNEMKELLKIHKKEIKFTVKSRNRLETYNVSGFNKPELIPTPLKKLLNIKEETMSRSKITKLLYQYFTQNNMYNKQTKKEIVPNKEIKKIFGMKEGDVINFYNVQTWLKKVYKENSDNVLKIEE